MPQHVVNVTNLGLPSANLNHYPFALAGSLHLGKTPDHVMWNYFAKRHHEHRAVHPGQGGKGFLLQSRSQFDI